MSSEQVLPQRFAVAFVNVISDSCFKFMDVETLVDMLEYSPNEADSFKFKAESDDGQVKVFNPDIPDFSLEATSLKDGKRDLPGVVL